MTDFASGQISVCEFGCSVLDSRGSALCKLFSGGILAGLEVYSFKLHRMLQFSLATVCIRNASQPNIYLVHGHIYFFSNYIIIGMNVYCK